MNEREREIEIEGWSKVDGWVLGPMLCCLGSNEGQKPTYRSKP